MEVEGTVLRGRAFEPIEGRVVVEDGKIVAVEETTTDADAIVCPAFVNAHTHIGDSIAKEAGRDLSLDELVAPPDGLKHRLLRDASTAEKVAAMRRSLRFMERSGTAATVEFREGGVEGVEAIREALQGLDIEATVLGRETTAAMEAGDGFGASGARDADFTAERAATREAGKPFGIHAGERDAEDLTPALDLDPTFLVHVVHPEPAHLERIERGGVPVVVCPRSNLVTGVGVPPMAELLDRTTVALGTDNVMLNSPSMFREMEFAAKVGGVGAVDVLRMATVNGAELVGLNCGLIEPGRAAKLLVLDGDSDNLAGVRDPVRAVVRRAGVDDVDRVVL
ncbi:amidohydrolase family protein [Haloplanus aerogenes]|uniref:Cytosine/adenosine deaminase-related metal-dependent hydrolase n=1 Tax=Haloplanus aerogenes TaxID=660522 RepID=A0A3M0DSP7_9EURY|nr:amidohydrolase family protein [Haloplanus aerogenes]AZH25422.1 nucleoside deaminase [Haloplanus aerogenes]RMB25134.1 cytosine/adenosine deaminase-related metal-dependent hydrolase [Haloplanus aerogenes]